MVYIFATRQISLLLNVIVHLPKGVGGCLNAGNHRGDDLKLDYKPICVV